MEILVCLKQVPDDSVEIRLKPGTEEVNLDGVANVVNAFDTYALEMAARLKEAVGGSVTAVTVGPEGAKDAVKTCLAVGANQGYLISDPAFEGADTLGRSKILAAAIKRLETEAGKPFDLIFCGREATDRATGQLGPQLAETLGVGVITDLVDIEQTAGGICAKQETEEGYRRVEAATPCVVTVNKPAYDPRYPTIKNKMAARKMPIPVLSAAELGQVDPGQPGVHVVKVYEPAKRQAGVKIKEETCADSAIKAVGMMAEAKLL
ncbi:electron transfer flavoprotein subunit beta/FixA family protein [Lawsonibacter celer]|jgi:electron transfer flavoprotein alpha/beta subunit|uniref:electron transfer flavoprotein subunit beta/FixA family protein n=1 Tax=Lawsonibacter celer TaxID=2986526 RepID=UPI00164747FE|nr:electron transfer flavoprotein subunit beta/FixA family protein [Lawsonibacter celer]